jgi:hypothetical protein
MCAPDMSVIIAYRNRVRKYRRIRVPGTVIRGFYRSWIAAAITAVNEWR